MKGKAATMIACGGILLLAAAANARVNANVVAAKKKAQADADADAAAKKAAETDEALKRHGDGLY